MDAIATSVGSPGRIDRNRILLAVSELLQREVALDTLLGQLIETVRDAMQVEVATLYLLDRTSGELISATPGSERKDRFRVGQGLSGHVAETGSLVNLDDPSEDARYWPLIDGSGLEPRTMLVAPAKDRRGAVLGVLELVNKKRGAFDSEDESLIKALASQVAMVVESTSLYGQLRGGSTGALLRGRFNRIVGESEPMRRVYEIIAKAADTDATVLITGETGTGKGLIARAIHYNSARREHPFVPVDCAALPGSLIENELFGHERGAYTGAERRAAGKFEIAEGGTVFIDEISELPLALQGKLLRVIQDREFERVGGTKTQRVNVRILAATNRDLEELVARGQFREDLYYRIRVINVRVPSLRERGREDVERLANHFLDRAARRHGKGVERIADAARGLLGAYPWPGNIRELENCVEGAVVLATGDAVYVEDLSLPNKAPARGQADSAELAGLSWEQMEKRYILAVLQVHKRNRTSAAKAMGIGRNTLLRKIKQYGL